MRPLAPLVILLCLATASAQEPGYIPGPGERGSQEVQGGEEAVLEAEVIAPAIDSRDPSWVPIYERHEDPQSVDCGQRSRCQTYRSNATGAA